MFEGLLKLNIWKLQIADAVATLLLNWGESRIFICTSEEAIPVMAEQTCDNYHDSARCKWPLY